MKIGILYICTGKYALFWPTFFKSMEIFFLPNFEKHYFVFTDQSISIMGDHIHVIEQRHLGWPFDTLLRFHMFYSIRDSLKELDYLFFLNANMLCVALIDESIVPKKEKLMGVLHPGFYNRPRSFFTYEKNPRSLAYIPYHKGSYYYMGGFSGGETKAYLKLSRTLASRIEQDLKKEVVALWHDESHLNRYLLHRRVLKLNPAYGYPEKWNLPFEKKIVIRDKRVYGGHVFLRQG